MEGLEELKAISIGAPEDGKAEVFTKTRGYINYYRVPNAGTWYVFKEGTWERAVRPTTSTRSLSDINRIIELVENSSIV